ncbi:MAG TPA: hypothetical protein DCZ94_09275 [Lentisphaeria bacterium]|nr:MAG: hypothetical protein A2X48_18370 [Lentisphaerae bacterium GWF2_49_21]HBC87131.1 hypothetical protein [Lentisphaeria bacterium]
MNLIKYFSFFLSLTKNKFLVFIGFIFTAAFMELIAGGVFLAVLEFESAKRGNNFLTRTVYSILSSMHLPSKEYELCALLATCCIAFAIGASVMIYSNWFSAKLEARIFMELQEDMVIRLFGAKFEYFISKNIGNLNNIIVHQIFKVSSSFKSFANILSNATLASAYLVYPLVLEPILPVLMFVMTLPLLFAFRHINSKTKYYSIRNTEELGKLYGIIYQILAHFKYLKATANYRKIVSKLREQNLGLTYVMRMQSLWGAISSDGFRPVVITEIFIIVIYMVVFKHHRIDYVIVLMAFLYMAYQKVISIQGAYQSFLVSSGAILVYEKMKSELFESDETKLLPGSDMPVFTGPITFENVTFRFESKDEPVLKNMSLEIKPNTTVAFVGGSGAGKSTLVNLICGLLFPQTGSMKISGKDYKTLDVSRLRESIGYVTQEPVIFNDTVLNNITLWDKSFSDSIVSVSKRASADEFIEQLPQKYDTLLGDNGINISGGQRQRITIARELSRNTPILIFDEATSSLDTETERKIQESIDQSHGEKTIIIIAHRLSTIKNSDMVYLLENGEIIEKGPYTELYEKNGRFRQMVDSQSLS